MIDAKTILRDYLSEIRRIHGTGHAVPETSYYGKMETLFTEIGKTVKPTVFCVLNIKNSGAGIPDGGLFIENQQNVHVNTPGFGQTPARGVIEAKPTKADVIAIANSDQVKKYLTAYGQVLVTNFYQFVLVTQDSLGKAMLGTPYSLAENEKDFWNKSISTIVKDHAEGLASFLQHVMMSASPISEPKDLAATLAFYARDAKARIERGDVDKNRLDEIKKDFETALGMKFQGKNGETFFRSTLIQTLFYGVFSAWVLWSETPDSSVPSARFEWRMSSWLLHVPVIRSLFERLATPSSLNRLGLIEVLDWTSDVLNRVTRQSFFKKFNTGEAIQYFYEPFLAEFDPQLRKSLGVWYTPPEIVKYMVERTDRVLREELGRPDGLADKNVYVLDPATGTGTYLAAVLERIYKTREQNDGVDAARNAVRDAVRNYIDKSPTGRIFGFEILPAPFVIAHLRLGLLLQQYGVPLDGEGERIGVYLTNSLTGWQAPEGAKSQPSIPTLFNEVDQANKVKRERKILVVIGNPPYDAFGGIATEEERVSVTEGLVDRYKKGLSTKWGIKKYNLDDLYIRFFRIAERIIAESTGEGVVCYISNKSYINKPSFVVMREQLLNEFDLLWFDNMNGDSRETGKKTPDGKSDPSVFSTDYNKAGIRQGTAISLLVRKHKRPANKISRYREFWGINKRIDLLNSLNDKDGKSLSRKDFDATYQEISPTALNRHSFLAQDVHNDYLSWPLVTDLCIERHNGLLEKRHGALIDIDRDLLKDRIQKYYDPNISWNELISSGNTITLDAAAYNAISVRPKIQKAETFSEKRLVRYGLHPFDIRYAYYSDVSPLWNRARRELWEQVWDGNSFFVTRPANPVDNEGIPVHFTNLLGDNDYQRGHSYYFPVRLRVKPVEKAKDWQPSLPDMSESDEAVIKANLSDKAKAYIKQLGMNDPDSDGDVAKLIWMHALVIGYTPNYLDEHEDGLRDDWPRIPLPKDSTLLYASAQLGNQLSDLLDTEKPLIYVTAGNIREELRLIGRPKGDERAVTADWGHEDSRGAVMPGKGDARERSYSADELTAIEKGTTALNIELDAALTLLGDTTYDLHLNDTTYWSNIPSNVYEYTIGGYQVIKKWLSYRNQNVIGRKLKYDEVSEITNMARRIAALILLQPQLNNNYREVKANIYDWPKT